MRFRDLRHGAAPRLRAQGLGLHEIMEVLGHAQMSITTILDTHIAPEVMRDAADRMDDVFRTG